MNNKPNLLIVEDDELSRKAYEVVFSKRFNVIICKNDIEFEQIVNSHKFDIFIIDISLVGMKDGIQIIEELRQMENYKSSPIIVVTANAFKKDEEISMAAGADKFIRKPIDNRLLMEEVYSLLIKN
ncbi:MAG: response regulator [Bacteroidota bacterium]